MSEHAHDHWGDSPDRFRQSTDPFGLHAYLARQFDSFAGGPSMAEVLVDLDKYRRPDVPTTAQIVDALHSSRQEREERLGNLWSR